MATRRSTISCSRESWGGGMDGVSMMRAAMLSFVGVVRVKSNEDGGLEAG